MGITTLRDRLADLAEAAPQARPAPELWDRGLRYRRRRRTAAAVVMTVAAVALLALGSATWLRSPSAVEPLPADSPAGLPDRLYTPSPWLPGTDDAGPLGTVAALIPARRGTWTGVEDGQVVGVSATTGEYRFLDLPGLAHDWALSPDGRYVAYLYREAGSDAPESAVTGLALYDATTGEVRRRALPGELGVTGYELLWAGDDTAVLSFGTVDDETGSHSLPQPLAAWNVHVEAPQLLTGLGRVYDILGAGPGFVVVRASQGLTFADTGTGVVLRRVTSQLGDAMTEPVFDASGERFAIVLGNRLPHLMSVGKLASAPDQPASYEEIPGTDRTFAAYAWIDDNHLALLQRKDAGRFARDVVVNDVDIRTGRATRIMSFDDLDVGFDRQLATDLLGRPTAEAVEPARPLDPRLVTGTGLAIALAAGWTLIVWRRRVRP